MRVLGFALVFGLVLVANADPLKLTLYYEALCPYSKNFTVNQLYPTYKLLGDDILTLEWVPFGNAQIYNISGTITVSCQHGSLECRGNKVQGCVASLYNQSQTADFINCDMATAVPGDDENLQKCAKDNGLDWAKILECADGEVGDQIVVNNAAKTAAVKPKFAYVPAIAFNDVFDQDVSDEAEYGLLAKVCELVNDNSTLPCK